MKTQNLTLKKFNQFLKITFVSASLLTFTACGGGGGYEPLEPAGEICDNEGPYSVSGILKQYRDPVNNSLYDLPAGVTIVFLGHDGNGWFQIGSTTTNSNGEFQTTISQELYDNYLRPNEYSSIDLRASHNIIDVNGEPYTVELEADANIRTNDCSYIFQDILIME